MTTGISWKKFHADVLAAMLGRWGALGAGFVTTMLLTRILPVADVGVYFIVLSLVLILGPLANVGLQEPRCGRSLPLLQPGIMRVPLP